MAKKRPKIRNRGQRPKKSSKSEVEVVIRKSAAGEAPVEKHFVVADGNKLKSILELAKALETMSEEIFKHHANDAKNDFSSWVREVFKDDMLADELAKAKDKLTMELVLWRKVVKDFLTK